MDLSFGARLAEARKATGMTQQQLAEQVGVSRRVIISYEHNRTCPRGPVLERLEKVLGVSLDDLDSFAPINIDYDRVIACSMSDESLAQIFGAFFDWIEDIAGEGRLSPTDCVGLNRFRQSTALYSERNRIESEIEGLKRELTKIEEKIKEMGG